MEYIRTAYLILRTIVGYAMSSSMDYKDDICEQPRLRLPLHWRRW